MAEPGKSGTGAVATENKKSGMNWKLIGGVLGIAIALWFANLPVFPGLTDKAMWAVAIFLCTVVWWMADVFPDYVTCIFMCAAWALFKVVPFTVAFSSFSNTIFWLLVGALGIAVAVGKSGLLNRIALLVMSKFPLTFKGQTLALLVTGTVLTPLIPSSNAKIAVVAPFATAISDNMGYERKSAGAAGIFSAMYVSLGCIHPLFISGSFMGYAVNGLLPKDIQAQMTWTNWFINALPWGITLLVLSYLAILVLYKPAEDKRLSPELIKEQIAALGPMKKGEIIVTVVLALTLLLWMTEKLHGVNSAIVALTSMGVLLAFNLFDRNSFRAAIPWDAAVFMGGILNLSVVFPMLKIDKWIGDLMGAYVVPVISQNILVFFTVMCVVIYVIRYVLASQLATITIFTLLLSPFAVKAGISPWIIAFTSYVAINVWTVMYQNIQYVTAFYLSGNGELVSHKQMIKLSVAYMVISLIGIMVSVPVWKLTGLIK